MKLRMEVFIILICAHCIRDYLTERLIFPNDPGGIADKVIFESEEENVYDEETEWISTVKTRRVYQWVYVNLYPEFIKTLDEE